MTVVIIVSLSRKLFMQKLFPLYHFISCLCFAFCSTFPYIFHCLPASRFFCYRGSWYVVCQASRENVTFCIRWSRYAVFFLLHGNSMLEPDCQCVLNVSLYSYRSDKDCFYCNFTVSNHLIIKTHALPLPAPFAL